MSISGQLHDLSLAELIEFLCNQRKTGRLKVDYALATGIFFIRGGELVDAQVGALDGNEAVYFALTLPSASFDFSAGLLSSRHTITDKWTSVVLEGLRRIDEGILPHMEAAFGDKKPDLSEAVAADLDCLANEGREKEAVKGQVKTEATVPFLLAVDSAASAGDNRKKLIAGVAVAVVVVCLIIAIPVTKRLTRADAPATTTPAPPAPPTVPQQSSEGTSAAPPLAPAEGETAISTSESEARDAELAAGRAREAKGREARLRAKREEEARKAEAAAKTVEASTAPTGGAKSVRVSIAYDEHGRVTQASAVGSTPGAEAYAAAAIRIARSRRFPAGKAGSTVVTIPMN